jgi:hypothetical protein
MEPERRLIRPLITDSGIIIAIITITCYFCALAKQMGYLNYFRVPVEFIPLSPTIVLGTSMNMVAFFWIYNLGYSVYNFY